MIKVISRLVIMILILPTLLSCQTERQIDYANKLECTYVGNDMYRCENQEVTCYEHSCKFKKLDQNKVDNGD